MSEACGIAREFERGGCVLSPAALGILKMLTGRLGWLAITFPLTVQQELREEGFAECDGHGKWRATDDGRAYVVSKVSEALSVVRAAGGAT